MVSVRCEPLWSNQVRTSLIDRDQCPGCRGGVQRFFRTRKLLCRRCGLSVHTPHPPGSTPLHPVQAVLIPIWSHRSSSSGPSGPHHHGPSVANPSSDIIMVPFWNPVVRPFWFPSSGPSGSRRPALLVPVVRSFLFPSSGPFVSVVQAFLFPSSGPFGSSLRPFCSLSPRLRLPEVGLSENMQCPIDCSRM